jgi:hypothetical protein
MVKGWAACGQVGIRWAEEHRPSRNHAACVQPVDLQHPLQFVHMLLACLLAQRRLMHEHYWLICRVQYGMQPDQHM